MDLKEINGILNIDKPAGITSAMVVARAKRLLIGNAGRRALKVGHAGTLDSFATGVLLILVGQATKRCEELMGSPKQYETTIRLGATTETLDPMSEPVVTPDASPPSQEVLLSALAGQVGHILQVPPKFSALKVCGKLASDRTRDGETLDLPPRPVRIDAIELIDYTWPDLKVRIDCGRGTYVRAIARDIGQALGVGGYLTQLRRTRVGEFWGKGAVPIDGLETDAAIRHLQT
ncbi:MAG: truB [Phycisphaerales bacterium]|nr:truB [Phycisphaerales bacterium]